MATLEIKLKKVNKIYTEGEKLSGIVVVVGKGEVLHSGITLHVEGSVNMQLSAKSVGLFEAFYNSVKPITLVNTTLEVAKAGKLPSGKTEIPFEITLKPSSGKKLYESYHGVFINVQYNIKCDMKRSLLLKDLTSTCEFIVEHKPDKEEAKAEKTRIDFKISPDSIKSPKQKSVRVPDFLIEGHLDSSVCSITRPFTGELCVRKSDEKIKSIEVQLIRVETCGCAEGYAKDATEIQNLQIADGDVCRNVYIPIYMIMPRLFTCPTNETTNFKLEFEVNIVTIFHDDYLVTENFPIRIYR